MVPMSRTMSMPGVPAGTTNIDACRCGRPSGLVSAKTSTMSATDAFVMNHLWPSMTHSSPSLVAVVPMTVGSAPAKNGSVSANALEISPRRFGQSHRSFCASVAPSASSSMFPLSGACTPKIVIDIMHRPMISDISASFIWPKPVAAELRVGNAPQSPCAFTCSCRWRLTGCHSSAVIRSKIGSSGISSRSMNARIQTSFSSNSGSVDIMKAGMESAQRLVMEGKAVGIGEIGRPHFPVPTEIKDASNQIMIYGMQLAKEAGCPVVLHTESATPENMREMALMADKVGLPRNKVVKHYSPPLVLEEENSGLFPSVLAKKESTLEALGKGLALLPGNGLSGRSRRPGAVLSITTVPKRTLSLLQSGQMTEEQAFKIHVDNPLAVYGIKVRS